MDRVESPCTDMFGRIRSTALTAYFSNYPTAQAIRRKMLSGPASPQRRIGRFFSNFRPSIPSSGDCQAETLCGETIYCLADTPDAACDPEDSNRSYLEVNVDECPLLDLDCNTGFTGFSAKTVSLLPFDFESAKRHALKASGRTQRLRHSDIARPALQFLVPQWHCVDDPLARHQGESGRVRGARWDI